jgi:Cytochrome c7 and related cytochrome c
VGILIAAFTFLTLSVAILLVATGGHPMRLFTAFGESLRGIAVNRASLGWMLLCVLGVAGFLFFFYEAPATRIGPVQPIAFSHRIHAGVKAIPCRFCHLYAERSIFPGMPTEKKCFYCHKYIITHHPEILKARHYFDTNTPMPWKKVVYLPEYVVFRHQRHVRRGIKCQVCHGPIQTMDRLPRRRFKMGFCVACHRREKVNTDCWLSCHN